MKLLARVTFIFCINFYASEYIVIPATPWETLECSQLTQMIQSNQPAQTILNAIYHNSHDTTYWQHNVYTALGKSIVYGHEALFDAITQLVPLGVTTQNGNSLAHFAAYGNQPQIMRKLLQLYHLNSNHKDLQGNAPIHFAALSDAVEILPVLHSFKTNFLSCNALGEHALHIACRCGHIRFVKELVEKYYTSLTCLDNNGNNALLHAASAQPAASESVLEYLLRKNISFLSNKKGETALHCAVMAGNISTIRKLLACKKDLKSTRNKYGALPALYAAAVGNIKAYELVCYPRKKYSETDQNKKNALHYAAHYGQHEMLNYLLSVPGFDINHQGLDGNRPIEEALIGRSVATVNAILNNTKYTRKDLSNLLYFACKYSNLENIANLLEKNYYLLPEPLPSGHNVIDVALISKKNDIVNYLRNIPNHNSAFLLHRALKANNFEMVQQLIERERYDINVPDTAGLSPLLLSAQQGNINVCKYLYVAGADLGFSTLNNENVLHIAITNHNLNLLKWLHDTGHFGIYHYTQQNNAGLTPIECADEQNIPLLDVISRYLWNLRSRKCSHCQKEKGMQELILYKKCAHVLCHYCDDIGIKRHCCIACTLNKNQVHFYQPH